MRDFNIFAQVLNVVVGKLADAASSTGSALARLKYIIDTSIPTAIAYSKKYGCYTNIQALFFETTSMPSSYTNVLSISGSGGYVYRLSAVADGLANNTLYIEITVDGNLTEIHPTSATAAAQIGTRTIGASVLAQDATRAIDLFGPFRFESSLLVRWRSSSVGSDASIAIQYGTDI